MGEKKVKDFQPPTEEPREGFSLDEIESGRDRPGRDEIEGFTGESSPHADPEATVRQMRPKDETKGDPDAREETKQDKAGAANQNG